jgi:hypothetical protein
MDSVQDENCALLGYYAARNDDSLPTFRNNLSVPLYVSIIQVLLEFLTLEEGTDSLSPKRR